MDATPTPLDPELLLAHAGFVRSVARSLLRDENSVDDVVQQTWLTAIERPPREAGALKGWLARVVRSVARGTRRSDERRARREVATAPSEIDPRDPSALVERLARMRALTDAVLALPPPYRDAIVRRHLEELSPAEIARRDGVPVATIETRLKRARKQLRERLEQSYGIGRDALALLVTGVKAGATWKAATLAAAATVLLAGAATWRVVAAVRGTETAAVASEGLGAPDHATSTGAAPRDTGGDPLVANVREIEPRLEWPDEASLRRLEHHGRALFGGIVFAPDGTPCVGAKILCDGSLLTTTDDRGAWRAEIAVDPPEGFNAKSTFQGGWQGEMKRLLLAYKEALGVAVAEVAVPSRRIDLRLDAGHSFSGRVVWYEDGRAIGDVALEVRLDIRRDQLHPSVLTLKGRADANGAFTFANVPSSSLWLSGRADGYDSNGFLGFDFTHERDFAVKLWLLRLITLRGRFAPWPCPGIAPEAASVVGLARSPHDGITGTSRSIAGAVSADGRFELSLPSCGSCGISLVAGGETPWEQTVDTSDAVREWDVGVVELSAPPIVTGRVELPADLDRTFITCTLRADYSREIPANIAQDGSFRAVLPSGSNRAGLVVDFGRIAQATNYDSTNLTEAEHEVAEVFLEPGNVRDVGWVAPHVSFVYGSIRDERGDPLAGAVVRVRAAYDSATFGADVTRDDAGTANVAGNFLGAIDLDPELGRIVAMDLEISAPGFAPQRFPQTIPDGARWVRRDLVLQDGVVLRGTLVDEHGAPCCGWAVVPSGFPYGTTFDRTRADGSFEIRGVADEPCEVTVREPDGVEHAFPGIRPGDGPVALRLPPAPSAADGDEGK
jgi:RNA polymerase sigma-70 factor (ECF subfamily)